MRSVEHRVFVIGEGVVYPNLHEKSLITKPSDLSEVIYSQGTLIGILQHDRRIDKYPHKGALIGNFFPSKYVDARKYEAAYRALMPDLGYHPPKDIWSAGEAISITSVLLALEDAGITRNIFDQAIPWQPRWESHKKPLRVGVGMTNSVGEVELIAQGAREGYTKRNVVRILRSVMPGYVNGAIVQTLESHGPTFHHSAACATAGVQIDAALDKLRNGSTDLALVGGFELAPDELMYGFEMIGAFPNFERYKSDPSRVVRPFDRDEKTFAFSEGAMTLVLATDETIERLRITPDNIKAEVIGSATGQDYSRLVPPEESYEYERVLRQALESAGITIFDIQAAIQHSPGTLASDRIALSALRRVLGLPEKSINDPADDIYPDLLKLTGPKAVTLHPFASSLAVTSHTIFDAMSTGVLPGTKNLENPHGMALNVSSNNVDVQIKHAFAGAESMDGTDVVIVYRRAPNEFPIYDRG